MPIQITARVDGFRRCGMAHSAKTQTYPDDHFTATALAVLENEPQLIVVRVSGDAEKSDGAARQLSAALEKLDAAGKASAVLAGERDSLKTRVAALERDVASANTTIETVSAERDALQESNTALTTERDALQAQLADAVKAKK
ncbi:HI1506-related protein [Pectobacterium sp. A5351]|uniref:HI1506-related protein n=1 Tax=Pectobacterium sp. A5351 TaxID=2914983 RepID=UPI00232DA99F|nr:HI1506-related protein [Pectobacterium sp. A5351]WCG83807.1 HI1506-related protein [Pectobacterium sp. A5351]